jgi:hypothetical protein
MIKKKFYSLLLAVVLIASSGTSSYANTISDRNTDAITPYFVVIGTINTNLLFQNGNAVCDVMVGVPQSSADKVKFDITLYRYSGSAWTQVTSWSNTANVNNSFAWFEEIKNVSSGCNYKFTGTVTCYKNNSVVESVNINSATGYY